MGPLAKWVDDHIFFRIPRMQLPSYNEQRANWQREIQEGGGYRQEGGQLWYGGKSSHNGQAEEFNEDCSTSLHDLSRVSPRSPMDREFTYSDADIDWLSVQLGVKWQNSKSILFREEVPYLGFRWNLRTQKVHLPDTKKRSTWQPLTSGEKIAHTTLSRHKNSTENYCTPLWLSQRDALTSPTWRQCSPPSITVFSARIPPPQGTPDDLAWWQRQLRCADIFIPIPRPHPLVEHGAFSDASSGVGVAITVGPQWRAW